MEDLAPLKTRQGSPGGEVKLDRFLELRASDRCDRPNPFTIPRIPNG